MPEKPDPPAWLAPHSQKPHAVAGGPSVGLGRSAGVLLLTAVLAGCALYLRSKKNPAPKASQILTYEAGAAFRDGRSAADAPATAAMPAAEPRRRLLTTPRSRENSASGPRTSHQKNDAQCWLLPQRRSEYFLNFSSVFSAFIRID